MKNNPAKKHVIVLDQIPDTSLILKDFGEVDYHDTFKIQLSTTDYAVDDITTAIFKTPQWVSYLLKIRDFIVKPFGLKTSDDIETTIEPYYSIGSRAVFFTVIDRNENEIVMAEDDKHLNFRISVMIEKNGSTCYVYLSTIVRFNNVFGRLYFIPVKPFHRMMIKSDLKKYVRENEQT